VTATGIDKVYDGTTAATVNLTTDALGGDVVTASYTSASFADANAGTGKTVSVSGISIGGSDAGNYNLLIPRLPQRLIFPRLTPSLLSPAGPEPTMVRLTGLPVLPPASSARTSLPCWTLGQFHQCAWRHRYLDLH